MNTCFRCLLAVLGILFWLFAAQAQAATYYVSPTGNNANPGTISQPFATLQKAHDVANPGDTIYMRGGSYPIATQTVFSRSGSSGKPIMVFNYPGEVPILDGSGNNNTGGYAMIRMADVAWWWIKGLEVANSPGYGIYLTRTTNNIIVEFCNVHHNVRLDGSGAGITADGTTSNILILNNDVHHNSINQPSGTGGDGIEVNYTKQLGNIVRGNRVWRNHDDGIDLWNAANVLVEDNWSWENGYDDNLQPTTGNGTGFKLGGSGAGDGNHIVRNNLAWRNAHNGFDDNSADIPMALYNNTGYTNAQVGGRNFAFYTAIPNVLRNNLAYNPNSVSFNAAVVQDHNSWNLPVTVDSADFVTLDFTANTGARQADGSLPVSSFLHLVSGSDLIDKGVNIGIPFTGIAPDLGAFEYNNSVALPQTPSNLLVQP